MFVQGEQTSIPPSIKKSLYPPEVLNIGYVSSDFSPDIFDSAGRHTPGGSNWYRVYTPAKYLARHGANVVLGNSFVQKDGEIIVEDLDGNFHDGLDIICLHKWMAEDAVRVIKAARAYGQVLVQDVDDDYWSLDPSNLAWAATHPKVHPESNLQHYFRSLAASSAITVSTPALEKRVRGFGRPVYVLPNAVDLEVWSVRPKRQDPPTIGWVGSTATRSGDLQILKGVIEPFCEKFGLRVYHGGNNTGFPSFAAETGVNPVRMKSDDMKSVFEYPSFFSKFQIGIAPLRKTTFNFSKSPIKVLEYAAAGIPSIGSDLPEYRRLHNEHGIGFVASKPRDWLYWLKRLLDEKFREAAADAWKVPLKKFDIADNWTQWRDAYWDMLMTS